MAETVTLQIPEALYQRLAIAAGATQRSLEDVILQALQIGSPDHSFLKKKGLRIFQ